MAVLAGDLNCAKLVAVGDPAYSVTNVLAFVRKHASSNSVIAIDAPLVIGNMIGQRPCETAVGVRYGRREASCHTSNLRLYPGAASVALARTLVEDGFMHAPIAAESDRVILEVYPHAAMVAIFDLPRTLKYKKGTAAEKRAGLLVLADHLRRLARAVPPLRSNDAFDSLMSRNLALVRGAALKQHEDRLDAVFCAYLAYYFWYWRMQRNEIFGSVGEGYIVNPILVDGGV
jgi:predicted RNase H-like nuclease